MGQAAACPSEGGCGNGRWLSKEDEQTYLSQFAGYTPGQSGGREAATRSRVETNLEERRSSSSCCRLPWGGRDDELVSASTGQPMRTDLPSLLGLHRADDAIGCHEVCGAVCMTEPPGGPPVPSSQGFAELGARAADGEVLPAPRPLRVPPEFAGLLYDWSAPSRCQVALSAKDQLRLQYCLRGFVVSMLSGVQLQLRLEPEEAANAPNGRNIDAVVFLSKDLSLLTISVAGVERSLPLKSVRWVRPPETDGKEPGGLAWFLPEERGRTVVLRVAGGRFVRLRLEQKEQATFMGTCLRLLVKASRDPATAATPAAGGGWHLA